MPRRKYIRNPPQKSSKSRRRPVRPPRLRLVEDPIPFGEGTPGYDANEDIEVQGAGMPSDFFRTTGAGIMHDTNPNQAGVRAAFMKFVVEDFLPEIEARIAALELGLVQRARADLKASFGRIEGGSVPSGTARQRNARRAAVRASIITHEGDAISTGDKS
jgi:hypothetical protein